MIPQKPIKSVAGTQRSLSLYNDSKIRKARQEFCRAKSSSLQPRNIPIVKRSQSYVRSKITYEFDRIVESLNLSEPLGKEAIFEILVRMGFLKSLHLFNNASVAHQNM